MSRLRHAMVLLALGACTEVDPSTSPYAHETPPPPPAPLQSLSRGMYLGGSGTDVIDDVVKGGNDLVFVVGGTDSPDFPFTDGSSPDTTTPAGCSRCPFDGFAAALNPDGTLRWATRIASPGYDRLVAANVIGNVLLVAGSSGERPGLTGWHGGTDPAGERGEQDGLVCQLDIDTGAISICMYLGGSGATGITDLHFTSAGNALTAVMISPTGEDLHLDPQYAGAFAGRYRSTPVGGDDVVVFRFSSTLVPFGAGNSWATYVGGTGDERGTPSIANHPGLDPVAVLTETTSTDADAPRGHLTTAPAGGGHAYLAQLSGDGTQLLYATYIGGNGDERVAAGTLLQVDATIIVGLTTTSTDLATTDLAQQNQHGGNGGPGCGDGDVWIGRYNAAASGAGSLLSATYLGGAQGEELGGLSLSTFQFDNAVMVTGTTSSSNFPVQNAAQPQLAGTPCAQQPGSADVFVTHLSGNLGLADSTYLGGSGIDFGSGVHRGFDDRTVVAGVTSSTNFPMRGGGGPLANGGQDGFITEYGQLPFVPETDAGFDGSPEPDGAGSGAYGEDGAFCVCGAGGSPAAGIGPLLLVIAGIRFRRRRHA